MITKTLICGYCGKEFQRTDYPSRFKMHEDAYCNKYCAMVGAREKFRPYQGIVLGNHGHLMSRKPNHPNRNKNNQVPFASIIMEEFLGRYLKSDEMVHHMDENPLNNDISNLKLMTIGGHVTLHNSLKERDNYGRFTKSLP